MSENNEAFSGGCLCGAVRYEITGEPRMMGDCFCLDCRKSSGAAHCAHMSVPKASVTMSVPKASVTMSGTVSSFDKPADSGNVVTRCFCPECGAPVYSTNSGMTDLLFIRASSLDNPEIYAPQFTVYTSRAPSWGRIDSKARSFEAMPPHMPGA